MKNFVIIKLEQDGFHYWPDPPEKYAFLGQKHRHKFFIEVKIEQQSEHYRQIEIIAAKEMIRDILEENFILCDEPYPNHFNFGQNSCEKIAEIIFNDINATLPYKPVQYVKVLEDNENGGMISA